MLTRLSLFGIFVSNALMVGVSDCESDCLSLSLPRIVSYDSYGTVGLESMDIAAVEARRQRKDEGQKSERSTHQPNHRQMHPDFFSCGLFSSVQSLLSSPHIDPQDILIERRETCSTNPELEVPADGLDPFTCKEERKEREKDEGPASHDSRSLSLC